MASDLKINEPRIGTRSTRAFAASPNLESLLRHSKAPSLHMLLAFVPDEPLMYAEPFVWGTKLPAGARLISLNRWCRKEWLPGGVPVTKLTGRLL